MPPQVVSSLRSGAALTGRHGSPLPLKCPKEGERRARARDISPGGLSRRSSDASRAPRSGSLTGVPYFAVRCAAASKGPMWSHVPPNRPLRPDPRTHLPYYRRTFELAPGLRELGPRAKGCTDCTPFIAYTCSAGRFSAQNPEYFCLSFADDVRWESPAGKPAWDSRHRSSLLSLRDGDLPERAARHASASLAQRAGSARPPARPPERRPLATQTQSPRISLGPTPLRLTPSRRTPTPAGESG